MAAVIGRDFDLELLAAATNTTEDDCPRRPRCRGGGGPGAGAGRWPGTVTTSPMPSSSTPSTRTSDRPGGPGPPAGGGGPGGTLRRSPRDTGRRTGPPLVQRHPAHRPGQGHQLLPPGGRRCTGALAPADALRYYARPSTSPGQRPRSSPRHRPGYRARHRTAPDRGLLPSRHPSRRARQAADLGDTDRLVAAAWPTTAGSSALGPSMPTRSRSWSWRSPDSHPPSRSGARPCHPLEETYGSPLGATVDDVVGPRGQ